MKDRNWIDFTAAMAVLIFILFMASAMEVMIGEPVGKAPMEKIGMMSVGIMLGWLARPNR